MAIAQVNARCRDSASAEKLQQMAHEAAASKQGKSMPSLWTRAILHQLAAQAHIQAGESRTISHCTPVLSVHMTVQVKQLSIA